MFSSYSPLALGWCLHAGFVLVSFVGGILFISWAMKLKPDQLKKWVMWLLIVGVLGSLITASYSFMGWKSMMLQNGNGYWNMMGGQGMMNFDGKSVITPGERALNR